AVLLGGAPPRMLHLSAAAQARLVDGAVSVTDATSAALARHLLDAGIAHPVVEPPDAVPPPSDVTVVIPVKDRTDGLARLLDALAAECLQRVIVVDDGSADPDAVRAVAKAAGADVLRHAISRGPAAARNAGLAAAITPVVAFFDSDVVPQPGWLPALLTRFADPAVGLVAPRIVALPPFTGWLGRYEAVRSSLDLGPDPALVVPRSRVAYVPSAALLVRRAAVGAGFDADMHVAEDVDLVLRLHAVGWRLRYEPTARVAHDHRTTFRAWWLRKAFYGTGAAPLALRHPGAVPPMVLSPTAAAMSVLLLLQRPLAALAVAGVATLRLSRKLQRLRNPRTTAARLIALAAVGAAAQTSDAVTRHYWPLSVLAALVSRRARRTVVAIAVGGAVVDWFRVSPDRPALPGFLLARRLDDLAYGAGLWWGAATHRTLEPLRPVGPSERATPKD
ncbi:MAG: mycofactocin biosynthesis glycosyltransferase MftF, partial [Pseudonocardiales bacterium]|nr:mycofactocin biosynthesis glycosyltransferase MftF [Pseudonocardiales bacterium]